MWRILLLALMITLGGISSGFGQQNDPRKVINYQGYLTDLNQKPVKDSGRLKFSIYKEKLGNKPSIWDEEHSKVDFLNGFFRVALGKNNPLTLNFDAPYWLAIKMLDNNTGAVIIEFSPRIPLNAVPYSFHSNIAETAKKMGPNGVTSFTIRDGEVKTVDLADSAVTLDKISPTNLDGTTVNNGNVLTFENKKIIWKTPAILDSNFTDQRYVNHSDTNAIQTDMITDGAITAVKLDPASVLQPIAAGVIDTTGNIILSGRNIKSAQWKELSSPGLSIWQCEIDINNITRYTENYMTIVTPIQGPNTYAFSAVTKTNDNNQLAIRIKNLYSSKWAKQKFQFITYKLSK